MLGLELVVILGVTVLACNIAGQHARITPPVLLLLAGEVVGFAPALRQVHLPPEVVLLLFLPALLYWESLTTSLRRSAETCAASCSWAPGWSSPPPRPSRPSRMASVSRTVG